MGAAKKAKVPAPPSPGKEARIAEPPANGRLSWSFDALDIGGPWCMSLASEGELELFFTMAREYSAKTWDDIEKDRTRDHGHAITDLCPKARRRLREIKNDEADFYWRLRFGGSERVWGIRDNDVFRMLWWDPWHEVFPLAHPPSGQGQAYSRWAAAHGGLDGSQKEIVRLHGVITDTESALEAEIIKVEAANAKLKQQDEEILNLRGLLADVSAHLRRPEDK